MYVVGIFIWRLGEALNDVNQEALIPDMVSEKQFQLASACKSGLSFLGGILGYVLIWLFAFMRFTWIYYAYVLLLFICAAPPLLLCSTDSAPYAGQRQSAQGEHEAGVLTRAYLVPLTYSSSYTRMCLAGLLWNACTAPLYFILLIVRDVVGVTDERALQHDFSVASFSFCLTAALCSVFLGGAAKPTGDSEDDVW